MSTSRIHVPALGLGLVMVFSTVAMAQGTTAPAAAPAGTASANAPAATKIGVVNIQDAIVATEEGKKEFDALQQKFAPKQGALKTQNDEVENLKKQLQAQGDKLSEDERNNRLRTVTDKQKALQRNYEDAQAEFQQAEQEVVNRIGGKMLKVLEKYSAQNGYAVVLDVSNPQTSPVLWATQGTVITKDLVDAYNAQHPVSGAGPAAKPAGSAAKPAAPAARPAGTPKKPQ